jgi:peptide/nickel transport system substrate-binding protein
MAPRRRRIATNLILLLVMLVVTGWSSPAPITTAQEASSCGPLRVGIAVDPVSLDPHNYQAGGIDLAIIDQITDGLVAFDQDMNIVPAMATEWEWEDDTTLRFTLRDGVTFQDGTPWNAEAAKANLDRMSEAATVASYYGLLESTEIVDDSTIRLTLSEPYAPFLRNLAAPVGGMVSPAAVEAAGEDFARQVVGAGPYQLREWTPREQLVLERNPTYWGEAPPTAEIIFRPIPEEGTRMLSFQSGELDAIQSPPPSDVAALEADDRFQIVRAPQLRNLWLGMVQGDETLDNVALRQAIAHAINREELVQFVAEGLVDEADALFPTAMMDLSSVAFPYDPERAQELLAEAGYNGETIQLWAPEGRYLKGTEIGEAIQAQLAAVGINTEFQVWEWATYNEEILNHSQQLWIQGWGFLTGDPDVMRALLYTDGPFNSFNLSDERVDELFDRGVTTVDEAERIAIYDELQTLLVQEMATLVPIYNQVGFYAVGANVEGFGLHPLELLDFSSTCVAAN